MVRPLVASAAHRRGPGSARGVAIDMRARTLCAAAAALSASSSCSPFWALAPPDGTTSGARYAPNSAIQGDDFFNSFGLPERDFDQQTLLSQVPANAAIEIQESSRGDVSITTGGYLSEMQVQAFMKWPTPPPMPTPKKSSTPRQPTSLSAPTPSW